MLLTEDELKKATVPQLKAICKEKGVAGYSKLSKAPLVAKLLEWQAKNASADDTTTPKKSAKAHKTAATSESIKSALGPPAPSNKPLALAASPSTPRTPVVLDAILSSAATAYTQHAIDPTEPATISQVSSSGLSAETPPSTTTQLLGNTISPAFHKISASSTLPTKRTKAHPPTVPPPAKKQKSTLLPASSSRLHATQSSAQSKSSPLPQKLQQQNAALASIRPPSIVLSKRPPLENHSIAQPAKRAALESISVDSNPIKSPLISLPPSIRNRKRVGPWSIILSAVEREDLPRCALVSRMFRYAVYITAGVRLERFYVGKRLVSDTKNTTTNKANLWPYLLTREKEMKARVGIYEQSWLARVFAAHCPIAWKLWACPDHPKQATIAANNDYRFLMTRLFFDVSVQERETRREDFVITDAHEVLPGEIWEVTTREAGSTKTCHVLEATCEVIGRVDPSLPKPAAALGDAAPSRDADSYLPVRADWSAYVAMRETSDADSLLQHVSWEHRGEYERGMSRLWLKRMTAEGEEGRIKLEIARRYVYACVCSNSVSGRYMRLTEMAQEFHGTGAQGIASGEHFMQKQTVKLNLFLPGHHHVESVHLATSNGTALHAAVAVVQTPGREYYILRDNGMQIGCEEDGVAQVFMEMLGCNRHGVAL
ncbi:hypothetical protein K525DRAFT_191326 [Schizophyllum commune Loenen D]|nr:hypothetical protein K525DRAFT_191326 [Schizophyllum commune Loenen D]